jgi:arsenate reductase (glutaredoxin)
VLRTSALQKSHRLLLARDTPMDVIIYHNPDCGTSRNTLGMIRNAGIEPHVVEYLKTPPSRTLLKQLIARMGISPRALLREKGTPFLELGLENPDLGDDELLDAMMAHPILINRPIVVTPNGVRLCRPSELVIDLLSPQRGEFVKEDGERVADPRSPAAA